MRGRGIEKFQLSQGTKTLLSSVSLLGMGSGLHIERERVGWWLERQQKKSRDSKKKAETRTEQNERARQERGRGKEKGKGNAEQKPKAPPMPGRLSDPSRTACPCPKILRPERAQP
ncbi:hypothetical protein SLA2020_303180 [Shorea laevis]